MSTEPTPSPAVETWVPLELQERRVLGVLIEKAKTTPDAYPMSVNSVVTACNQKTNRDPLLDLSDFDVEEALTRCQKRGLAIKITGGRVIRWRHALYEAWKLDKVEIAILGELLLRGPQTEGELRSRASRMEDIADLDVLRTVLKPLVMRGLVVYLTQENRRGSILSHGFHAPKELERLRTRHTTESQHREVEEASSAPALVASPRLIADEQARAEIAELREQLAALRGTVGELSEQVKGLKEALGG